MNELLRLRLTRIQKFAIVIAVAGAIACVIGAFTSRQHFFIAYLFSVLFWLGVSLGCFMISMIHHLTAGRWGDVTRRFLEAGYMVLPVMALLFVPLFFGLRDLYPWARPVEVAADVVLQKRQAYSNSWGFVARTILCFVIWTSIACCLRKWSLQQDQTSDLTPTRKLRALSGAGVVIYPMTGTFVFVDWIMSLEPRWFSTMFPIIIIISQILSAFAFAIIMLAWFERQPPMADAITTVHRHQLGNLLLTFVLFWTYISFGQLLIIYSGNLPPEIGWYLHRVAGNWKWIIAVIALFHFFLPFYVLLFRSVKKAAWPLTCIAWIVFVSSMVDVFWYIKPTFFPTGINVHWLDFAAPIAVGGVWLAIFFAGLKRHELLLRNDPRIRYKVASHAS